MFDQLTWATGMFSLTAFVSVIVIYGFRNNIVVRANPCSWFRHRSTLFI